jgi:hypothetical protein
MQIRVYRQRSRIKDRQETVEQSSGYQKTGWSMTYTHVTFQAVRPSSLVRLPRLSATEPPSPPPPNRTVMNYGMPSGLSARCREPISNHRRLFRYMSFGPSLLKYLSCGGTVAARRRSRPRRRWVRRPATRRAKKRLAYYAINCQ